MEAFSIILKKLKEDICLCQVIPMPNSIMLFILSVLCLMLRHNESFHQIYHQSYLKNCLVNNYFLNKVKKFKYIKFQIVLNFILKVRRHFIAIKKDIKGNFQNINCLIALIVNRFYIKEQIFQKNVFVLQLCYDVIQF